MPGQSVPFLSFTAQKLEKCKQLAVVKIAIFKDVWPKDFLKRGNQITTWNILYLLNFAVNIYFFLFPVLGSKTRTLDTLGMCFTTDLLQIVI